MHTIFQHVLAPLAVTTTDIAPGIRGDVWGLILNAGPVVKVVIALLILLSVGCWGIMVYKYLVLRAAINESERFLGIFWEETRLNRMYREAEELPSSPLAEIFRSGYIELERCRPREAPAGGPPGPDEVLAPHRSGISTIQRALDQARTSEQSRLEKNLSFLATTGSTAPFIGLFGTVWGIMEAFRQIGMRGSANLATVAPGISEALIATAFGLVAAIPAVVGYNYFMGRINLIVSEMENFSAEFLNILERYFQSRAHHGTDTE